MNYLLLDILNLSDKEKAIRNVLETEKLPQDVSQIARKVNIPRTTTAYILRNLAR